MVSSYTTRNRFNKQGTGDNTNTWGDVLNSAVFDLTDFALDGWTSFNPTGNVTLTTANGATDQARARCLKLTTATTTAVTTIPALEKFYAIWNATSAAQTIVSAGGGTSVSIAADEVVFVICDAVNVKRLNLLTMSSQRLQNVADPTGNQDAATKKYVDDTVNAAVFSTGEFGVPVAPGDAGKFLTNNGSIPSWGYPTVASISDYASDQATKQAATLASAASAATAIAIAFAVAL